MNEKRLLTVMGGIKFSPASLPSLVLWLDASVITGLSDDDPVTTWADLSGAGLDAVQAVEAKQPKYKTSIINGLPVVRFDGGDALVTSTNDIASDKASVFIVCTVASGGDHILLEHGTTISVATKPFSLSRGADNKLNALILGAVGYNYNLSSLLVNTTPFLACGIFDKSLETKEATQYINGVTGGTQPIDANNTDAFGTANSFYIGERNGASVYLTGDIGEIIVYNSALSDLNRKKVENYLQRKWGLSFT